MKKCTYYSHKVNTSGFVNKTASSYSSCGGRWGLAVSVQYDP